MVAKSKGLPRTAREQIVHKTEVLESSERPITDSVSTDVHEVMSDQGNIAREVWDNFENEERRRELSHWRGYGKYKDDTRWKSIGRKTIGTIELIQRMLGSEKPLIGSDSNILEWGPGGGANAFALGGMCRSYYGVDISMINLNEAKRLCDEEGIGSFKPVHLLERIDNVRRLVEPIDFFLSTAVFQHFPSREYGRLVLDELGTICRPRAVGFIQIRYESGKFVGVSDPVHYKDNFVTATSYEIGEFAEACRSAGFAILFLCDINENVNYVTFCLRRLPNR